MVSIIASRTWAFQEPITGPLKFKMAEIRHLENRHDVIFSAEGGLIWIKFSRLVQNDLSTALIWSKSKPDVNSNMAVVWTNSMACHSTATCHIAGCCHLAVTFCDSTLNTANLCLAITVMGLFYLFTVIMNFVCWFIFRHRFHQKVPVLHVCLVIIAGNCFWCILEEMFLVV